MAAAELAPLCPTLPPPPPPSSRRPFDTALWPASWPSKVWRSDIGIGVMLAGLGLWAAKAGAGAVALMYGLPLVFTNMWLVGPGPSVAKRKG